MDKLREHKRRTEDFEKRANKGFAVWSGASSSAEEAHALESLTSSDGWLETKCVSHCNSNVQILKTREEFRQKAQTDMELAKGKPPHKVWHSQELVRPARIAQKMTGISASVSHGRVPMEFTEILCNLMRVRK